MSKWIENEADSFCESNIGLSPALDAGGGVPGRLHSALLKFTYADCHHRSAHSSRGEAMVSIDSLC